MTRQEALAAGLNKYEGKACKCGSTIKFVSGYNCVACVTKRTKTRDSVVYKKYIKSEKGQDWLKKYRNSPVFRAVQNRWSVLSGFHREQQHRRRAQMLDGLAKLTEEEWTRMKAIYAEAGRLTSESESCFHVDHVKQLSEGGKHHPDNLQILKEVDHWAKCAEENKLRNK